MFRKSSPILWLVSLAALFTLGGCGYTLSHRLKDSMTSSRGVFVRVFDNITEEIGAEIIFTNALIHELQSRGEIVLTEDNTQSVQLRGRVENIFYTATASHGAGYAGLQPWLALPSELGVSVDVTITLHDPKGQFPGYSKGFNGFQRVTVPTNRTYDVEAPSTFGPIAQSSIESVYPEIARIIMRDVYDDLVEIF